MSVLSSLHGASSTLLSNLFVSLPVPQEIPGLPQQTIIVTGSNVGLGLETCRHLLRHGVGKLIMAVRSPAKGEAARRDLLASTGRSEESTEVWELDMDSYESVKSFARRASELARLDGVLANAGIMTTTFALSEGSEKTLTVNVISTFLLCLLLIPKMRESSEKTGNTSHFVIPNSALHYLAPYTELDNTDDILHKLNDEKLANMTGRYNLSKLLVLYAVRELAERSKSSAGGSFIINSPNPSYCQSQLSREIDSHAARMAEKVLARTTEQGSRVLYHALFGGPESNGAYLTNCHIQTPARHVTGSWGQQMQKKFFDGLLAKLEQIQPNISQVLG